MSGLLEQVKELKNRARAERERGNDDATKTLETAIELLRGSIQTLDPKLQHRAAAQLADLYGMLGGTLRERGDLIRAAQAYDAGFVYESDPSYGIDSSYNAINRLLTRISLCLQSLTDANALRTERKLEFVDVPRELINLHARLESQIGSARSNDYWAAGDLALVSALAGDDDNAAKAAARFASCSPPTNAYEAYLKSVQVLADLDTPRKESLERLKAQFSAAA